MDDFDAIMVVNGAGELASLVKPAVLRLLERAPQARIILVLTPCQYATGHELRMAQGIKGVYRTITTREYLKWALLKVAPKDIRFKKRGIVVFMGGDLFHGRILSRRLGYPAIAYSEHYPFQKKHYAKFMVPDQLIFNKFKKAGLEPGKMDIIGNLMVDGAVSNLDNLNKEALAKKWGLDPSKDLIALLPGSRLFQARQTIAYYLDAVKIIKDRLSNTQPAIVLSPFMSIERLEKTVNKYLKDVKLVKKEDKYFLIKNGTSLPVINSSQYDFIKASTLAVTVPGTNTADIAALGVPMLVFFPFNRMDLVPLGGLFGWISSLPVIGFYLKVIYGRIADRYTKFFALPNIKSGKEIVPEFRGWFTPKDVAEKVVYLLKDKERLGRIGRDAKAAMGPAGASDKMVGEILRIINK